MGNDKPTDRHADAERAAADWLARRDGEAWADADEAALAQWLAADTAHRVAFLRLQAAWDESGRLQALGAGWQAEQAPPRDWWQGTPQARREQMLQAMAGRGRATTTTRRRTLPLAFAASLLLACGLALGWAWQQRDPAATTAYAAALGEMREVALADGSHATLASDSQLEVRLGRRERHVALLRGEAIFDVAHDARRPFVVDAGGRRVVVVGTRFSVRTDARSLRVVVTEGTVRLQARPERADSRPSALLPAGSMALVRDDGVLVRSMPLAEAEGLLGWREGLLVFRDATLADAAAEFNRYNARKIEIADARAGALRIGGSFRWDNADGFARLLERGFPVRADVSDQRIVLASH